MRFLLVIFFVGLAYTTLAQTSHADSLKMLIANERDDKRKVELFNELSFHYFDIDMDGANTTTDNALTLARKIKDKEGEGWATCYRGLYFFLQGSLKDAASYFKKSLTIGSDLKDINLQVYSLTQLANAYRDKGSFDSALLFYERAEKVMKSKPDITYSFALKKNLARYFLVLDEADKAKEVLEDALKLSEALKDSMLIADTWMLLGNCYSNKSDFDKAEYFYNKAYKASVGDALVEADYRKGMAELYYRRGDFKKSIENWSLVLAYNRKTQYKYALVSTLVRMGEVLQDEGYYDLALKHLSGSLEISEKAPFSSLVADAYYNIAWAFYRNRSVDLAKSYIQKAKTVYKSLALESKYKWCMNLSGLIKVDNKEYDSALFFYQQSLTESIRTNNVIRVSASLFNVGEMYLAKEDFATALSYYWKGLKIDLNIGDQYGQSLYFDRIGRIYTNINQFDSAKIYLEKAIAIAVPTSGTDIFRVAYIDMAEYLQKTGRADEAINYYKKFNLFSDSLFNRQTAQSQAAFKILHDIESSEQQINLLNRTNELNRVQLQRQRLILYTAAFGSLVFLAIGIFYYRFSQRLKKLNVSISEKTEEIQAQAEELSEANDGLYKLNREIAEQKEEIQAQSEELKESNEAILRVNENLEQSIEDRTSELRQAYKELDTFFYRSSHDFRRPLTTFMGLAEVAKIIVKDTAALELFEKVNENARNLDKMLRKLQSISDVGAQELIYKEVFLKDVFDIEVDNLREELDKRKIHVSISVKLEHSLFSYAALLKIAIQNLLENAIAFSTMNQPLIRIEAFELNNEVVIQVHDNGQGIEPEYMDRVFEMYFRANEQSKGNGLGLYIVLKTIQKLQGRVTIESTFGKETVVSLFLPYQLS